MLKKSQFNLFLYYRESQSSSGLSNCLQKRSLFFSPLLPNTRYELHYLVVSHEPGHWNFSENTNLSEVLLVARKNTTGRRTSSPKVRCINLWRQPRNAIEALSVAKRVLEAESMDITTDVGSTELIGQKKFGEIFDVSWETMKKDLISLYCCFAQTELIRVLENLRKGNIYIPSLGIVGQVPLCPLSEIANLGPDPRDVYDGFALSEDSTTPFPALWGHDAQTVKTMNSEPNVYLIPLSTPLPGRNLRHATDLWPRAGRALIAQRIRLNTKRLFAVRMSTKVLADVWWPLSLLDSISNHSEAEKALVLWLNSTLGIVCLLGYREETAGAWVQYKKPILSRMPVLDVRRMQRTKLQKLASAYDALSEKPLKALPELDNDSARHEIDTCLMQMFDLQDLSVLREMIAREPILCQSLERLSFR